MLLNKLIKICDLFNTSRYNFKLFSRFNIPSREEMKDDVERLNIEVIEKEKFLNQGNISVREYIKDKIGYVHTI